MTRFGLLCITVFAGLVSNAESRTIYVDSRTGNNAYDGTSAQPLNAYVGPVRSLQRAMQLVHRGDTLVLTDNGTPYYGSLTLFGSRCSGVIGRPFTLEGNGAVISGTKPIHPSSWEQVGEGLWRITPVRKGHFQLIENGEAAPRIELPRTPQSLPDISDNTEMTAGSWGVFKQRIYYKTVIGDHPRLHHLELATAGVGLTLLGVRDVLIRNITFRHFRIDGINAHDRCQSVVFDNVTCEENGRAGLTVAGNSTVLIRNSLFAGNREHSLLVTERGSAESQQNEFDQRPTVEE